MPVCPIQHWSDREFAVDRLYSSIQCEPLFRVLKTNPIDENPLGIHLFNSLLHSLWRNGLQQEVIWRDYSIWVGRGETKLLFKKGLCQSRSATPLQQTVVLHR